MLPIIFSLSITISNEEIPQMNNQFSESRRNVLLGASAVAGLSMAGSVIGGESHKHHHAKNPNLSIVDTSLACMKTGQACLSHCMSEFKQGNNKMADCASTVQEMLAMCSVMSQMVGFESTHVKKVASACIDVCDSCIKECDKHATDHESCKVCRDACKDCVKEMKNIV